MEKKILIEGMSCGHCVGHVERALKEVKESIEVKVDLEGKNAVIKLKEDISNEKLKEVVEEAGYDVVAIENL
ncbi:heavy metal transport/detoxification protein [Clostridium aceticum]|uniref:Heavy metal transport/detoxification protein n=1 Tax=Clostridium aceticum TaxID=84022 RepID=A0A0D8IA54_9CLOT|nr:heavy metal-associated domain-containing protein [Clostridium aceticum]AKL93560.1 heavy metal transport/detoxification protein [Clostridium aceticum]KJF27153.1 heavy metal transport/detoxification protein [Clostridium aceticum]